MPVIIHITSVSAHRSSVSSRATHQWLMQLWTIQDTGDKTNSIWPKLFQRSRHDHLTSEHMHAHKQVKNIHGTWKQKWPSVNQMVHCHSVNKTVHCHCIRWYTVTQSIRRHNVTASDGTLSLSQSDGTLSLHQMVHCHSVNQTAHCHCIRWYTVTQSIRWHIVTASDGTLSLLICTLKIL